MKSAVFKKTPNQHPTAVVLLLPSNHRLGRLRQGESCVKRSVVWSIRLRPEGTAVLHGIWNSRLISFGFFISTAKAELFIFSTETFFILLSLYLNACKFCDVANEGDPVITQIVHGAPCTNWWHHVEWIVKLFSDLRHGYDSVWPFN